MFCGKGYYIKIKTINKGKDEEKRGIDHEIRETHEKEKKGQGKKNTLEKLINPCYIYPEQPKMIKKFDGMNNRIDETNNRTAKLEKSMNEGFNNLRMFIMALLVGVGGLFLKVIGFFVAFLCISYYI